jgi:hypothetical protein
MAIFEVGKDSIQQLDVISFRASGLHERTDIQRLLKTKFDVIDPDVLIIAEEFGEWTDSKRRIDLLGVDRNANLVVIELKRTEDGGHMELQALRYAAMVSTLTAERAVEIFEAYRERQADGESARQALLDFLEWEDLDEDKFGQDVRILLVAADFSRELTTSVMWLNECDLDIRCVRLRPYAYQGKTLIDVQQVIPLPEAADYQIQVRAKKQHEKKPPTSNADFTRYNIDIEGQVYKNLWKRNGVLLVVKKLVERGVSPDEIGSLLAPLKQGRSWQVVDGAVYDVVEFNRLAEEDARSKSRSYDHRRWHLHEGDLFAFAGKTYAFTNQWGGNFHTAMELLKDAYPQVSLAWTPCEDEE